jgi:hypothetical protein
VPAFLPQAVACIPFLSKLQKKLTMNTWLYFIALTFILLSCISSLKAFRLDMPRHFKYLSFFLWFTLLSEIFAYAWPRYLYEHTPYDYSNQWFYNVYHIIGCCFLIYFFTCVLVKQAIQKAIKVLGVGYVLFAVANLCFLQGPVQLNTYTEWAASGLLIFFSIAYFYQLLYDPNIVSIRHDPVFWISTGVLINALGSILGLSLINLMHLFSHEKASIFLLLIQISGLLAYLTFSIAFLCPKKNR